MPTVRKPVSCADTDLVLALGDFRFDSPEKAEKWRAIVEDCPHVVYTLAIDGNPLGMVCVYALPRHKRWWLTALEARPSLAGAETATVTFFARASPDTVLLPAGGTEGDPPCGSECGKCPFYRTKCQGCPASRFFAAGFSRDGDAQPGDLASPAEKG